MTGRVEFERCIASAADERKLRKILPAITDTGLNAPKRKEYKKQKNVPSPKKKMKEMPETAYENMSVCHHHIEYHQWLHSIGNFCRISTLKPIFSRNNWPKSMLIC